MDTTRLTLPKAPAGYALVPPVWVLSAFCALQEGMPHAVPLALQGLGYLIVFVVTVDWGRDRGFPLRTPTGAFSGENLLRCLVMGFIMVLPIALVTGVLIMLLYPLAF